jgi:hypothetical protein
MGTDSVPLSDYDELLHRQVHPSWIRDGRITSQAFRPTKKDDKKLSIDRGSLTDPANAFREYVKQGRASVGVWSVTVGECGGAKVKAYPDPLPDDPAHGVIDFSSLPSNSAIEAAGDRLARAARERNASYLPDSTGGGGA